MKRILITGKNSYIGTSFKKWVSQWPDKYQVDEVETRDNIWQNRNFSKYDAILHVAGIAHIKETKENQELYYKINRDLAFTIAEEAKAEGIKQFIFLSSMSVYGINSGIIDEYTVENPKSAYGKSKLEAEALINTLADDSFEVSIVRPPMVYGKGCKGNYPRLSKLALKTPVFPEIENQRSMIYIDNLSEFFKQLIDNQSEGIYCPQNEEYVNTSKMVEMIVEVHGKQLTLTKLFNPFLKKVEINIFKKVFDDLIYDQKISEYSNDYRIVNFEESIKLTEEQD